ncbi:hypothetical protein EBZ39_01110 [bacterium]|nr:hypothetical protein [bacterium]
MTNIPLDQAHDVSGRETHRLTTLYPQPDFVKNAAHEKLSGAADLPRHLYADQRHKLYPCHTAPATWMSALFFADKQAQFDAREAAAIQSRIHQAAEYFGIRGAVTELEEKVAASAAQDINSLPDSEFAIVWVSDVGGKERHWPLRNAEEVKFAAAHFKTFRDNFVFDDRHVIATKILEKAAQYDADVSGAEGSLELAAGLGACAAKVASDMIKDRVRLTRRQHAQLAVELSKLAEAVDQNPEMARTVDMRLKLASAVDNFDRNTNLYRLYDAGGLPRPEEVLFAITEKVARDFMAQNVETTTGNVYALDDLEKLAVDDVREWLGDDFADAVSAGGVYMDREKLAAIVPTLDRGMAAMLDRLMSEKSAGAVVKSASADSLLSLARLHELAAGG